MREMSKDEVKEVCFNTLKYIKKICDENGINYSLTGGTLLGAVRHKGFIPWDDDCDVFMARPEYEKFQLAMEKQDSYLWLTRKHDPNYHYSFGRVVDKRTIVIDEGISEIEGYGVFVDVCVVDGLPNNRLKRWAHIWKVRILYRCRRSASYSNKEYIPQNKLKRFVKQIFQKYTRKVGVAKWSDRVERCVDRYPFDGGELVGNVMSQYGTREIMHRSSFDDYIELPFEDTKFKVCAGWEEYLTHIYGNYLELPPEEKRVGHHMGTAYWRD